MKSRLAEIVVAGLLAGLSASPVQAAEGSLRRIGANVDINDDAMTGLIAGGAEVTVKGKSSGRVVLFGANIQLDAEVANALYAFGADVRTSGAIKGDAELIGSRLSIGSAIDGNLTALGSRVGVGSTSRIAGDATLTGANVAYAGETLGHLAIEASEVEFSGSAKGPLRIEAPQIHFAQGAVIEGDADLYTIADPIIDPGAKITGHLNKHSLSEISAARAFAAAGPGGHIIPAIFLLGSAMMAGLMFLWLGRGGAEGAIDELIDSPASSGLWGLATVLLLPVAALILSLTIIGAPVGALALLALPLLLLLGYACAGLGLGELVFNRLGEPRSAGARALHLLAGLIGLSVLGLIPWAGPLVLLLATLCGLGALLRTLHDRMHGSGVA
jgi:cytoskeletal protein CcmA (bactofilin family)